MKKLLFLLLISANSVGFSQFIQWNGASFSGGSGPGGAPGPGDESAFFYIAAAGCVISSSAEVNNIFMNTGATLTLSSGANLEAVSSLTVSASATVTIVNGTILTIGNDISNSGTIIVQDGGNLVQTGSGFASGTYQVSQSGSGSANNYNFWSSPIDEPSLPSVFSGANGCDFYYYNAAAAEFRRLSAYSACVPAVTADGSSTMTNGLGYSVAGGGSPTFTGTVNTGSVPVSVSNGWNLIGNPYPSAISCDSFLLTNTNTTGTFYFWSDDGSAGAGYNETTDYATWNLGGGTGATGGGASTIPNGSIPVAQGFFVSVNSGSTINFENNMRLNANNSQFFKDQEVIQRAWISAMAPENSSQILFAFTANATEDEDWGYDSKKYYSGDDFAFGSMLGENSEPYAIQSFAKQDLETQREVPLSIFSTTSGVTSFQLDNTENLDSNVVISIIDNVTGKVQILENGPMAVYLNANQLYDNRFTIQFKNKNAPDPTGVNDIQESRLNLTYNEKTLFINNVIGMERIDLVSTTGSIVESQSLNSSFESTVNLNNLSKGIYIARILNIDGSVDTKKFVIQ